MKKIFKIQLGRNMLEMLGVLAIIGVLSALVITGYKIAVNKHKANDTIYDANFIAGIIATGNQMEKAVAEEYLSFSEYTQTKSGYTFESVKETDEIFSVSALNVQKNVCDRIIGMANVDFAIGVNNTSYEDFTNENTCAETNKINFYFDNSNTVKCGGRICYGGKICEAEECVCPAETTFVNGKCTCNASKPNQCGTECFAACAAGEFDCELKQCVCTEPSHQRYPVNGKCVCPAGKEEGGDGKCHTKSCSGGTSGNKDWTCTIDDERCGYNCTEDGLTCNHGVCDKGKCPSGTTHAYHSGQDLFGCKDAQGVTCMHKGGASPLIFCYHPVDGQTTCSNGCTRLEHSSCSYGLCDPSKCPQGTEFNKMYTGMGYASAYSCRTAQLSCTKGSTTTILCATSNGSMCGIDCTYDGQCTGTPNFCPKEGCEDWEVKDTTTNECVPVCPEGTTYSKVNKTHRCTRADGVYCTLVSSASNWCYFQNGKPCGHPCSLDANCQYGTCNASDCPNDLTYQNVLSAYAGCYNSETGIGCYPSNITRTRWTCYQNETSCTGTCTDAYGNGCCQEFTCPAGTTKTTHKVDGSTYNACYNPKYDTTCRSDKYCYRSGINCGSSCNLDGTGCTSSKKCAETDCAEGQTLLPSDWKCHDVDVECELGNCTINGANCGSGCNSDGSNCDYGICVTSDCPPDTVLAKVNTSAYACRNSTGISCYKEDGKYSCSKGGTLCASGCKIFNAQQRFECAYDTCES